MLPERDIVPIEDLKTRPAEWVELEVGHATFNGLNKVEFDLIHGNFRTSAPKVVNKPPEAPAP